MTQQTSFQLEPTSVLSIKQHSTAYHRGSTDGHTLVAHLEGPSDVPHSSVHVTLVLKQTSPTTTESLEMRENESAYGGETIHHQPTLLQHLSCQREVTQTVVDYTQFVVDQRVGRIQS